MKKLIYLIIYMTTVIGLLASCRQEEAPVATETKTVQINLSTRVGQTEAGSDDENTIHSIRVYVFDATNKLVGYHHESDITAQGTYIFQMPLNFSLKEDFSTGTVQAKFYIIVNEDAVKLSGELPEPLLENGMPAEGNTVIPDNLTNLTFSGYGTAGIQTSVPQEGLPMSYQNDNITLNTETGQMLEFGLIRAVSRIKVAFRNENNSESLNINSLKFGLFIADKAYLFPREDVPGDISYSSGEVTVNIQAPFQQTSEAVSCYLLPSAAGEGNYQFGFNDYPLQKLEVNDNGAYSNIAELPRNTSLNIEATIKGDYIIFDIPNVNPWGEATGGIIIVD